MWLFAGLGNPGADYEKQRHNVGFMAVERIADRFCFGRFTRNFHGLVAEGRLPGAASQPRLAADKGRAVRNGKQLREPALDKTASDSQKILLLKPQTFVNNAGQSIAAAMRFYKLPPDRVVVFYDELDLAPFKVKVRRGGGAAGHKGIRSAMAHIGAGFWRVRIGIGHPGDKARVHRHVLGDFAKAEQASLETLLDAIAAQAPWLTRGDGPRFMTEIARQGQDSETDKKRDRNTPTKTITAKNTMAKTTTATVLTKLLSRKDDS